MLQSYTFFFIICKFWRKKILIAWQSDAILKKYSYICRPPTPQSACGWRCGTWW